MKIKSGEPTELGKEEKIVKLNAPLTIEDVRVVKKEMIVDWPKLNIVPTTKYVVKEEATKKYVSKEEPTTKYVTKEVDTTKYNVREETTTKYIPKDEETIKYTIKKVPTEKFIPVEKEVDLITYKDLGAIKELLKILPELMKHLKTLKEYKLVTEEIKVPDVKYIPTEVPRVVFKDIPKERCAVCGRVV